MQSWSDLFNNNPFSCSKSESESIDIFMHLEEFSNMHNKSSNVTQSKLLSKNV